MTMNIKKTNLPGLLVIEPKAHKDDRGFFMETWRDDWLSLLGVDRPFLQDNHAASHSAGVLRGLHYQAPPHAQAKLVWVTKGSVFDVAVDLRVGSPTFGHWHSVVLSAENFLRFYIPRGFAHGYMTLEPYTEFQYKVDNYYDAASEGGIRWDSPELAIPWEKNVTPLLSDKDTILPCLSEIESPFLYGRE